MYPIHFFERSAHRWPDAIAAECGGETVTYADLLASAHALAAGLQAIDPEFGSRVGICCYNSLDHLTAFLATLAAGKVWVPLQAMNTAEELVRAAEFTEASILIVSAETPPCRVAVMKCVRFSFLLRDFEDLLHDQTQLRPSIEPAS